jgi:hypothetical protein|tara:strand:+ start:3472 stop:4080 length:609 start_codon:yes stop_codon:yes gene_type:complete
MKHVGYDIASKRKYVVVFRELPDDTKNALVVDTGNLTDRYHDGLMSAVESTEAQNSEDLYKVLDRKLFFDGENVLAHLHVKKFLKKVATNTVVLSPTPGTEIPLDKHNEHLGSIVIPEESSNKPSDFVAGSVEQDNTIGIARNLIIQAQLLEEDARKKRAEAENVHPGINDETKRPRGRPKKDSPVSPLLNKVEGNIENENI